MNMRKTTIILMIIAVIFAQGVFADAITLQSPYANIVQSAGKSAEGTLYASQLGVSSVDVKIPDNPVLLALGSADYPVTPGDKYVLSYYDGSSLITLNLQADIDCQVSIPTFGTVDAADMTFGDFARTVETMVGNYMPYSSPQVTLVSCGLFSVRVSGAVKYSQVVTVWGLSRLSSLAPYADDFASTRAVEVVLSDGRTETYDLLKALRGGAFEEDPLLKPGSEVRFLPASRIISVSGAVKRPGTYQPLEGETLDEIITNYCGGYLLSADKDNVTVSLLRDGVNVTENLEGQDQVASYVPSDGDSIFVAYNTQNLPYVTVTGAITAADSSNSLTGTNVAGKVTYRFVPGETALQLVRNISNLLTSTSDVAGMYILRDGERIQIDASDALISNENGNVVLQQGDTVVIPFSQLTVVVSGAVNNPGTFSYVPDRGAEYYINLAKGYSDDASKRYKVVDRDGKKVTGDVVPADATIIVSKNNLVANIALTASILGIVTSVLSIILDVQEIAQ